MAGALGSGSLLDSKHHPPSPNTTPLLSRLGFCSKSNEEAEIGPAPAKACFRKKGSGAAP